MQIGFSSNVVLAKVQAMYGKRIRADDYTNLLNCRTVGEVSSYLKNKTDYFKVLDKVDESNIRRGPLETLIKRKMFYDLAILCRYELSLRESLAEYIIGKAEVEQIIKSLIYIYSHNKPKELTRIPDYFSKQTKINLDKVLRSENYDQFLDALGNSPYKKLLKDIQLKDDESINLSQAEAILYDYLHGMIFEQLKKNATKKVQSDLTSIFETYIDFGNFVRILRTQRNNSSNEFAVLKYGKLKKRHIDEMLKVNSEKDLFNIMGSTNQGRKLEFLEYKYIDQIPYKAVYDKCRHNLHFSIDASLAMLSYIFLMQIEISNIIKIIEGVRYQLPKKEIEELLIVK